MADPTESNPYVGARPFERDPTDQARFFGRDREALEIVSLIFGHPVVLVYAQSGAGKTSLFNVKVAAALEEQRFAVPPLVRIRSLLPLEASVKNLYVFNLLSNLKPTAKPRELRKKNIAAFLKELPRHVDARGRQNPRVIICDQFEEFFGLYPEGWKQQREEFFQQVAAALEADPLLRVVFVVREDYLAQLDPFARFLPEGFRWHFRLERLRQPAALLAVTGPLRESDCSFGQGVAEYLVENLMKIRVETQKPGAVETVEVTGEFVDPTQLQVVCQSIWNRVCRDGLREITRDYVVDVDEALADFYESAIKTAAPTILDEVRLRDWCESFLITSTGTRGLIHRELKETGGLSNKLLDVLKERHLINLQSRAGADWYELTHDRLIEPIRRSNEKWAAWREQRIEDAQAKFQRASLSASRKKFDIAISEYRKTLRIYEEIAHLPAAALALINIGYIYQQQGRMKEARESYSRAVDVAWQTDDKSISISALMCLGSLDDYMENFVDAVSCFTKVLKLEPNNAEAFGARARAYWYEGSLALAREDFTQELELSPNSTYALSGRGQVLAEMGEYKLALRDLDYVVETTNDRADSTLIAYARNGRGLAFGGLGRYEEALKEFKASIDVAPDNGWVYFNRALTFERMGDLEKAVADYKLSLDKTNPPLNPLKRRRATERLREL
jgi:tetratricopeptide (TPR) repeat protein